MNQLNSFKVLHYTVVFSHEFKVKTGGFVISKANFTRLSPFKRKIFAFTRKITANCDIYFS